VIDANIGVWSVLPVLAQLDVSGHLRQWQADAVNLVAPALWVAETVSAIRRAIHTRVITRDEGLEAIEHLFALGIESRPMEPDLCRSALLWAGRLQQVRAYDAFYMALAEELGVEFWTADQRLANAAAQLGVAWTHWIGEAASE
jgi:predicted nucleic acid-binding protein